MNDSLYFLAILAEALGQPEAARSLEIALTQIKRKGRQQRYGEGFSNFRCFMTAICSHAEELDLDVVRELIAERATDALEDTEQERTLPRILRSHPQWKLEYEQLRAEQTDLSLARESPVVGVLGSAGKIGEMVVPHVPGRACLDGISPGVCVLKLLNTGRILWQGELTARDLVWTAAYGDRALELAAQTGAGERRPTRKWALPDKKMVLRTFAGPEQGMIEIELTR